MDLFKLETFLAVAREGGFSRAAKKLNRTQPSVSQTIRRLEQEVGEVLFHRSNRDGMLTEAGRVLQIHAQRLMNIRDEAQHALAELRQLGAGTLRISANEFTCMYLLPLLDEFRQLCPMIEVIVQRALASKLTEELRNHNSELGMLSFRPRDADVKTIVVYRDELAFVVHGGHPLAAHKELTIRQLGAECFIAHNVPSPHRSKVIETFRAKNVPLHMDVQLPSIEAIKKFVAARKGVALLPAICVEAEVARGELAALPVRELRFERKLRLVHLRGVSLSYPARAFLNVVQSFGNRGVGRFVYKPE